jgi:hypothetical protein
VAVDNIVMRSVVLTGANTPAAVVAGQLTGPAPNLAPADPTGQLASAAALLAAQADNVPPVPAGDDGPPDPEDAVIGAIAALDTAFTQQVATSWQEPGVTPKGPDWALDQVLVDILGIGGDNGDLFQV